MIIIIGPSGSGKDFLFRQLKEAGFPVSLGYTTRAPRDGEINGINYFFVSEKQFEYLKSQGFFLETAPYGGNYYGTPMKDYNDNCIKIMEPQGLKQILEKGLNPVSIYVHANEKTRYKRMLGRGDKETSIQERLTLDNEIFKEFENHSAESSLTDITFDNDNNLTEEKLEVLVSRLKEISDMKRSVKNTKFNIFI